MSELKAKLWNEGGSALHPKISEYIFSPQLCEDRKLLKYDILASKSHAKMLANIGIFTPDELEKIIKTLGEIDALGGDFNLAGFEDIHSAIENYLTEKLGDLGKKIHTGRSRNDQVLTAMRLFTIAEMQKICENIKELAKKIAEFAIKYEFIPMPGFTHMQHAMPSSVGQWAGAFLESLLNDLHCIHAGTRLINQNPLGSAAGFGTSFPLDRNFTTKDIGFEKTMINSLFCQNSRGKFEIFAISCLSQVMLTLEKMANDIIIFCSQEFRFFTASNAITTGSSIMPQKRNLDAMEVMRGKSAKIFANLSQMTVLCHNLISGYNKDLKFSKSAIMESLEIADSSLKIMEITMENLSPNEEILHQTFAKDSTIFATDVANNLVIHQGMSFRDAYHMVKNNLAQLENINPVENIKSKTHIGATGNLMIHEILQEILKIC